MSNSDMEVKNRNTKSKSAGSLPVQGTDERLVIAEIGRIVNSSFVIDEVFEQLEQQTRQLISYDRFRINLIDEETDPLKNVFVAGLDVPER